MPELPEVETIHRVTQPQIQGSTIENIDIRRPEVIARPEAAEFRRRLIGQTFSGMSRRGKFLIFHLADDSRLLLHLRMTGCLLVTPPDLPEEKHTHVVFRLDNGHELRFSDLRRFGRFWLFGSNEEDTVSGISKLGLEPFDKALTAEYLQNAFGSRRKAIKECLMEQGIIAGIGNIYSDELLFSAGVLPSRPANSLSKAEWERLALLIPEKMSYFVEKNSISFEDFLLTKGQDYRNTPFLQVYGHAGEHCPICGHALCRLKIGGRSSVFCPCCQQ